MTARRRKVPAVSDPLQRSCPACGARKGQGCKVGDGGRLITRAARLVHADRLEQVEPIGGANA